MSQATNAKRVFRHQLLPSTETTKSVFGSLSVYPASAHSCRCQMWGDQTIRDQTKIECASRFDTLIERVGHRTGATNLESLVLENPDKIIRLAISIRMICAYAATCDKGNLPGR